MKKGIIVLLAILFFTVNIAIAAVNINTADKEALASLKGIGDVKAEAILKYRKDHGDFKDVNDLVNVKGIGPKTLEKLATDITINPTMKHN